MDRSTLASRDDSIFSGLFPFPLASLCLSLLHQKHTKEDVYGGQNRMVPEGVKVKIFNL